MVLCGAGGSDISAGNGVDLGGYWGRSSGTSGVFKPVCCRVLVVRDDDDSEVVAIVSLDLIGVDAETAGQLRTAVADAIAATWITVPKISVLVCCTHTHTAPQTHRQMIGMGFAGEEYMATLTKFVVAAANDAVACARPARCVASKVQGAETKFAVNRRESDAASADAAVPEGLKWFEVGGGTKLGQNPHGPTVAQAYIVHFVDTDDSGAPIGTIVQYACHPTCAGKDTLQSPDWCGGARSQVEALTGAPCLTLQGYCGDLNPRQHRAGYVVADKLGQDLGTLLVASIQTAKIVSATPVRSAEATVKLSVAPPLSAEEASSFKQQQEAWLAEVKRNGGDLRAPTCCMHYAERLCDGPPVDAIDFRVHTIRIGDIAIVGAEGELFCQYQHTLERMSPAPFTLACGYAQGCIGYVPSASEFHRGGYEVLHAHVVYGQPQRLTSACEATIIDAMQATLGETHSLVAHRVDSKFELAHDTYNAIGCVSSGDVYYALSSESPTDGGRLYKYNPTDDVVVPLGDLTAMCDRGTIAAGTTRSQSLAQGKSHVPFFEDTTKGEIYFGSHVGYYSCIDGMEVLPTAESLSDGLTPYPGGCILQHTISTSATVVKARIPDGEGILAMTRCQVSGNIFCLTWPSGKLVHVTPAGDVRLYEYPGRGEGEAVHPRTGQYRCVCRSMVVVPSVGGSPGVVYWTNADGDVLQFSPMDRTVCIAMENITGMQRDYFGRYDHTQPGSMAYNWRQVQWVPDLWGGTVVGVHGNSGTLFYFWPRGRGCAPKAEIAVGPRIASGPSQRAGQHDQFSYGYLGFAVAKWGGSESGVNTVFYLTGAPMYEDGMRVRGKSITAKGEAKGLEHLHLVTYEIEAERFKDHGPIFLDSPGQPFPTYVNSLAVAADGNQVFALGRVELEGVTDLFVVDVPNVRT